MTSLRTTPGEEKKKKKKTQSYSFFEKQSYTQTSGILTFEVSLDARHVYVRTCVQRCRNTLLRGLRPSFTHIRTLFPSELGDSRSARSRSLLPIYLSLGPAHDPSMLSHMHPALKFLSHIWHIRFLSKRVSMERKTGRYQVTDILLFLSLSLPDILLSFSPTCETHLGFLNFTLKVFLTTVQGCRHTQICRMMSSSSQVDAITLACARSSPRAVIDRLSAYT